MRRLDAAIALAVMLAGSGTLRAQAKTPTLDALTNGSAEATTTPRGKHRGVACFALDGWQLEDRDGFVAQADGWGGMHAASGNAFVRANKTTPGALWQDVALGDDGKVRSLLLSAQVQTGRDRDRVEVSLALLDGDGTVLATRSTGSLGSATWTRVWLALTPDGAIATRARTARVTFTASHHEGQYLDAFADDFALWIVGPSWPSGLQGMPDKDLVAMSEGSGPSKLAALAALMNGSARARGERLLTEALTATTDTGARQELLALLALCGHRDAKKTLQATLERGQAMERALALELLPNVSGFDWRKVATELSRSADPGARGAGLRALVRDGSKDSQRALAALHTEADDAGKLDVVRALAGRDAPLDDAYRVVLLPHLTSNAGSDLRHAALMALAQWSDVRLLAHVAELLPHEEQRGRRAAWLAACARLDSLAAAEVLVQLAVDDVARADSALLLHLPKMRAPAVLAWAHKHGLRHAHPLARLAAVRVLHARGTAADARALLTLIRDPDADVAANALAAAAKLAKGEDLATVLGAMRTAAPSATTRALSALWPGGSPTADVLEATLALARAPNATVRAAALACLGATHAPSELVAQALDDAAWQVRVVAYRALANVRTRKSFDAIMQHLPKETGSSLRAATEALATLAGVHKGPHAEAWSAWWKLAAATFEVPAAARATPAAPETAEATTARYHGVPIDGTKIAFVLDLSGSMRDVPRDRSLTKLRAAQDELTAALRRLTPQQAFAIIGFADGAQVFAEQLLPATADHVDKACQWLARSEAKGWTNLWSGLSAALLLPDIDTVFLLSDGAPSVGRFVDALLIREEVRARDVARVVRVHAVVLDGDRFDRAFLAGLAADSGGVCVEAK